MIDTTGCVSDPKRCDATAHTPRCNAQRGLDAVRAAYPRATRPTSGTPLEELGPDFIGENVLDLVVDLLHLAHAAGSSPAGLLDDALETYREEVSA